MSSAAAPGYRNGAQFTVGDGTHNLDGGFGDADQVNAAPTNTTHTPDAMQASDQTPADRQPAEPTFETPASFDGWANTAHACPPFGAQPLPRLSTLRRDPHRGKMAGVCAGLATQTGIDVVLIRALMVLASICGGLGIVLYGLAWLIVPAAGQDAGLVEKFIPGWAHWSLTWRRCVIAVIVVASCVVTARISPVSWAPVVVLVACFFLARWHVRHNELVEQMHRAGRPAPGLASTNTAAPLPPVTVWPTPEALSSFAPAPVAGMPPHPMAWSYPLNALADTRTARRQAKLVKQYQSSRTQRSRLKVAPDPHQRRRLRMVGVFTAVAALGAGVAAAYFVDLWLGVPAALAVVALGLLVGSRWGHSISLILLGLCLSFSVLLPPSGPSGLVSQASYSYATASSLPPAVNLTGGGSQLDLSDLVVTDDIHLTVTASNSLATIVLPPNQSAEVNYAVSDGALTFPGRVVAGNGEHGGWVSHGPASQHILYVTVTVTSAVVTVRQP